MKIVCSICKKTVMASKDRYNKIKEKGMLDNYKCRECRKK